MKSGKFLSGVGVVGLLLLQLAGSPSARAAEQPDQPTAHFTPPGTIPAGPANEDHIRGEEIADRADRLERYIETTRPDHHGAMTFEKIDNALTALTPVLNERIAQSAEVATHASSLVEIDDARRELEATAIPVSQWREKLEHRIKATGQLLEELDHDFGLWTRTQRNAETAEAGEDMPRRVEAILAAIVQAQRDHRAARMKLLTIHDRIVDRSQAVEGALERLHAASTEAGESVLLPTRPPIWRLHLSDLSGELEKARTELAAFSDDIQLYLQRDERPLVMQAIVTVLLLVMMGRISRQAREKLGDRTSAVRALLVLQRPWSAALTVAILLTPMLHPASPRRLQQLAIMSAIIPAARLLQKLGAPLTTGIFAALGAVLVVDWLSLMLGLLPVLGRLVYSLMLLGALGLSLHVTRHLRREVAPTSWALTAASVSNWVLTLALLAELAGWSVLAAILGHAVLAASTAGLQIYAALVTLDAVALYLLAQPALDRSRVVRAQSSTVHTVIFRILCVLAALLWIRLVLLRMGILPTVLEELHALMGLSMSVGDATISVGGVGASLLTLLAVPVVARTVDLVLSEEIYPRSELPRGIPLVLSTLVRYGLYTIGMLIALKMAGLHLTEVSILLGGLGLGVGMGLQDVVKNFAAGISVLLERRVQVGDALQIPSQDIFGRVLSIGIRATVVRNWDGSEVLVPNSDLISAPVTNWSLSDRHQRIEIAIGVAYGANPSQVMSLLVEAAQASDEVLKTPAPQAHLVGFSEGSVDFVVRAWIDAEYERASGIRTRLGLRVHDMLTSHGIELSHPSAA